MGMGNHRLLLSVFVFGIIFIGDSLGQAVKRNSFGQNCNETNKCDKGAWLTCQNSSCVCMLEDMVYDQAKLKCVSKSGERCKFQISELTATNIGIALFENTDCVSNANCNNGFTCACDSGFYETMDGKCMEQKDVNQTCISSVECKEDKLLFCIEGSCQCSNESQHIYGRPNKNTTQSLKCVGKAGKTISGTDACLEGTSLQDGICTCEPRDTFYAAEDGRCHQKKSRASTCVKDEECQFKGIYLSCVDRVCNCAPRKYMALTFKKKRKLIETGEEIEVYGYKNPDVIAHYRELKITRDDDMFISRHAAAHVRGTWHRGDPYKFGYINTKIEKTIEETLSQCVGLARLPCNPESNCVKDSECQADSTGAQLCTCRSGFSPTSLGTCGIGYGESCSNSTSCSDSFLCTKGKCNCPQINHQVYNSELKKCTGLVSSFCTDQSDCLPNSACENNPKVGRKRCSCSPGFVENGAGRCEKAWGSECDYRDAVVCDSIARLQCRNGICSCPDTMTLFDPTVRKCLGLVGSRCEARNGSGCVSGAVCVQEISEVAGECLCPDGFVVDGDMQCLKVVDEETTLLADAEIESTATPTTQGTLPTTTSPIEWTTTPMEDANEIQHGDRDDFN